MALYELAVMGGPTAGQIAELERYVSEGITPFGLHLGREVVWSVCPIDFNVPQKTPAAIAFFVPPEFQKRASTQLCVTEFLFFLSPQRRPILLPKFRIA
jgi:hypothetical protein